MSAMPEGLPAAFPIIRSVFRPVIRAIAAVLLWSQTLRGAFHTLSGCVSDDKGAPVPGAIIDLSELEGPLKSALVADKRGCYKLELLPDGAYEIRAAQNGLTIAVKQFVLDQRKMNLTVDLRY